MEDDVLLRQITRLPDFNSRGLKETMKTYLSVLPVEFLTLLVHQSHHLGAHASLLHDRQVQY